MRAGKQPRGATSDAPWNRQAVSLKNSRLIRAVAAACRGPFLYAVWKTSCSAATAAGLAPQVRSHGASANAASSATLRPGARPDGMVCVRRAHDA